ncbi:DUF4129 domain-containing protein [Streptomyces ovatisporus]|uniref:DUF4129 domain-containing protein n=1 Tax=Streptomyces ovatisporus TaxID=1128682 RepID=A0ABV9AH21_9ACTN
MPGGVAIAGLHFDIGVPTGRTGLDDDGVPVTTPRAPAREAAERELSKGEYHQDDPGLFQRILDWLWEHIASLLDSAAKATPGGWTGLTVIACLLVLLLVALRLRLGRILPGPATTEGSLFNSRPRTAAEHRATAETHAAAERWTEAVKERMRAVFRSLEERALLDRRPGRTADEAAFEAGLALPDHAETLRSAARSFDEVTYANRKSDAATYSTVRDLDTAIQRATPRLPGTSTLHDLDTADTREGRETPADSLEGGGR